MSSLFFSFFLSNAKSLIRLNTNLLETNLINILLLVGFLVYASNIPLKLILEKRKNDIIQMLDNAQEDVVISLNYYSNTELDLKKTLFLLEAWRAFYKQENIQNLELNYNSLKKAFNETFQTTESLFQNFESKAYITLQQSVLITVTCEIIRKFLYFSKKEQSKFLELTILNLTELAKLGDYYQ